MTSLSSLSSHYPIILSYLFTVILSSCHFNMATYGLTNGQHRDLQICFADKQDVKSAPPTLEEPLFIVLCARPSSLSLCSGTSAQFSQSRGGTDLQAAPSPSRAPASRKVLVPASASGLWLSWAQ